jgi:hypothetical protein
MSECLDQPTEGPRRPGDNPNTLNDGDEAVLDELEKAIIEQLSPLTADRRKLTLTTIKTHFTLILIELKNEYGHTIDKSIRAQK